MKPWTEPRCIQYDQLWVIASGQGQIKTQNDTHVIEQGNHFIFRKGHVYDISQDPNHPMEVLFVGFMISGNVEQYYQDAPNHPASLKSDLAQQVISMMHDLYWDAYISYSLKGNDTQAGDILPYMRVGELKKVKHLLPPNPVIYHIQPSHEDHPSVRSGNSFFNTLIQELVRSSAIGNSAHHFAGASMHHQKVILDSARRMQNNPQSVKNVQGIASDCGYSADHYTRVFKKIIGCHPRDYIINARIGRARDWLKDSELSIKHIAFELGYQNSQHFSNQFKELTGLTPSQYRKNPL